MQCLSAATSPTSWKGNRTVGAAEDTGDSEQNAHQLFGSTFGIEDHAMQSCFTQVPRMCCSRSWKTELLCLARSVKLRLTLKSAVP